MNMHVHLVSLKCADSLLDVFMYFLGNITIGYEEIW